MFRPVAQLVGEVIAYGWGVYMLLLAVAFALALLGYLFWYRWLPELCAYRGFHIGRCVMCGKLGWVMNDDHLHDMCWLEMK